MKTEIYRVHGMIHEIETNIKFSSLSKSKSKMKEMFNSNNGYTRLFLFKFDEELDGEIQINTKTTINEH